MTTRLKRVCAIVVVMLYLLSALQSILPPVSVPPQSQMEQDLEHDSLGGLSPNFSSHLHLLRITERLCRISILCQAFLSPRYTIPPADSAALVVRVWGTASDSMEGVLRSPNRATAMWL